MFELINAASLLSPLFAVAVAIVVFLRRHERKDASGQRSLGLFALGFLAFGVLSFLLGFWVVNEFSCRGAQYAECALGGLLIGGPLGFTVATSAYVYFWSKNGKRPDTKSQMEPS